MSRNIFGQVILLIVFLSLFIFAFSEVSILEVSKVSFFILLSISTLFIAFGVIQNFPAEENKKVVIAPPTDITFFPNLSIFSTCLQKNRTSSKKARNAYLLSSSESSSDKEVSITSSGLVPESPELIAKVIKTWYQDDE